MLEYVYCDESLSEAFVNPRQGTAHLAIGSIWTDRVSVPVHRRRIGELRAMHQVHGEMKWRKISPAGVEFYRDLIRLFFAAGQELRFRAIVVPTATLDLRYHRNDPELGFYKFYYQMLVHRMVRNNDYRIFCDERPDREKCRLRDLQRCLEAKTHASVEVQALPSSEVVLMQLCDVLLGAVSAKFNQSTVASPAKRAVIEEIESSLGRPIARTLPSAWKFNIFQIQPGLQIQPRVHR